MEPQDIIKAMFKAELIAGGIPADEVDKIIAKLDAAKEDNIK